MIHYKNCPVKPVAGDVVRDCYGSEFDIKAVGEEGLVIFGHGGNAPLTENATLLKPVWRTNTGEQQVGDGVEVEVGFK